MCCPMGAQNKKPQKFGKVEKQERRCAAAEDGSARCGDPVLEDSQLGAVTLLLRGGTIQIPWTKSLSLKSSRRATAQLSPRAGRSSERAARSGAAAVLNKFVTTLCKSPRPGL